MVAPREIELKLELDPPRSGRGELPRWDARRIPALQALRDEPETRRLVSAIFDTPDHALRRGGLVLRIRRDGERWVQTLKADARDGSLLDRAEWESEVGGDTPDLAAIPDGALREEVAAAGTLSPVLETEFERTLWQLRHHGSDVELSLDRGMIRAGDRMTPISEIEIELKTGAPTALFGLAREIVGAVPARLGVQSKSERGYGLLAAAGEAKAEPYRVRRKMRVGAAFQTIARACLRQYRLHEPGIFRREAEALHKGRVSIRRLRSAFKLHKALLADEEGERLKRGLRVLSRGLGTARNLDVLLERLEADDPMRARIEEDRALAYDRLIARLRAKRSRLLLLDVMAYVEVGEWQRDPARRELRDSRAHDFAAKIIGKRWRRLGKKGRDLADQTPEARHEVRIEGKVLRYASEFYAGAFPGRKAKKRREALLDALTDLQTQLGDLNDIEAGLLVTSGLGAGAQPPDEARTQTLLVAAQAAHKRVRKAKPFWA